MDDYIDCGNSNVFDFGTSEFTISLWVYYNSILGEQVLIEKFYEGGGPGWTFTKLDGGDILFTAGAGSSITISDPLLSINEWNHILIKHTQPTRDLTIYLNGDSLSSSDGGNLSTSIESLDTRLYIGRRNPESLQDFYQNGFIDDVRIYNTALSTTEIQALYEEGGWTGN